MEFGSRSFESKLLHLRATVINIGLLKLIICTGLAFIFVTTFTHQFCIVGKWLSAESRCVHWKQILEGGSEECY